MKKTIILLVSICVLGVLAWLVYDLTSKSGTTIKTELIDFAIKDVSKVDKFIISDDSGAAFEVIKEKDQWMDKNGGCISQENVKHVLDAFEKIEFKGYLPEGTVEHHVKMMSAKHIKVEIFEDGSLTKTWYIGPPTQDHYGQVMLLDSKEHGKSDLPVIMQIKGVKGIIEPRFYVDQRKWECTNIFSLEPKEIKKIEVKYTEEKFRSFSVSNFGNSFSVFQNNKSLPFVDTAMVFRYLNNYKKIHFNIPNYILNEKQIDSLKKTTPFCILTVDEHKGKSTRLKLYKIPTEDSGYNDIGQNVPYDADNFWCVLPNGKLVKCQYFVFNPLILGHIYFPLDMRELKTDGYEIKDPKSYH